VTPDAIAYILYSSGTTGEPKGIFQNHRNVLHKVMNYTNTSHLATEERLSLLVSLGFSAAVPNVFAALLNGAALFPFSLKEGGLANLSKRLIEERITIYQSVTSVFRNFVDTLSGAEEFPELRLIDLFGDPVLPGDIERYKKYFSVHCLLRNRMASTELGDALQYFVSKETPIKGGVVPVGHPVQDKEILLLDEAGRDVGFNQLGEIVVRSRYLALGYWGKPELTRATFLSDPRGGNGRIYRTGDLGYKLPDGCLVHVGRNDFQVKVRGYRFEVSEIERLLLNLTAVKAAVVVAREDQDDPGEQRLVAYLVPDNCPAPSVSELRDFLKDKLPDYMVPSAFVFLDRLPLTHNGKIDRKALPVPDQCRPELEEIYVAPRTPVEEMIAEIWAEVLKLDRVGVHDNFFDLGGHSLLATQIISKVLTTLQV
jgi:acyl-coenzyme A synthetase/AMP-(fatty) acid ligase